MMLTARSLVPSRRSTRDERSKQAIDAYHSDLRRTRGQSIIPVDTKLAAGITRIFPQFNDRFEAIAVRVPTIARDKAIDLA